MVMPRPKGKPMKIAKSIMKSLGRDIPSAKGSFQSDQQSVNSLASGKKHQKIGY